MASFLFRSPSKNKPRIHSPIFFLRRRTLPSHTNRRCTSRRHCGPTDSRPIPQLNLRPTTNRRLQPLPPSGSWSILWTVRGSFARLLLLSEQASETPALSLAFSESVVFVASSSPFAPLLNPILRLSFSARLSPCPSFKVWNSPIVPCVNFFLLLLLSKTVTQRRRLNQLYFCF